MERIEEEMGDVEYHQYQHFLSDSPWDHQAVLLRVGQEAHRIMAEERRKSGKPTGLIVDESAHLKQGEHSVGVARQYAGVIGKVENCQVGVYASLCTGERSCLIKERLFLPQSWINDKSRSEKAGIPQTSRIYKTKLALALEMINQAVAEGIHFDWVGGDGLYGHGAELAQAIEDRGLLFVLDVHKDQRIFTAPPRIAVAQRRGDRGRSPSRLQADRQPLRVDEYAQGLPQTSWKKVRVRQTTKGWLTAWIHLSEVWVWDGQETAARKRTLILRKPLPSKGEKPDIKYSLSNGGLERYTWEEFAYFQAQRYWVERDFENGKSELGLSDYQVRKWLGWHHHHAIVFMAMSFLLRERIEHESQYPLMSLRDARILVTTLIAQTILEAEPRMTRQLLLMKKRHDQRQRDIDRYYSTAE